MTATTAMTTKNKPTKNIHDEPTEADKQSDLERQYKACEKGDTDTVFCPWCFKGNRPETPACCGFFAQGVTAYGQRQFQSVINQLKEVRFGARKGINCPYCHKRCVYKEHPTDWIRPMVSPFCCDMLSDVATAIVERKTLERLTADKKRIEDATSRQAATTKAANN